MISHTELCLGSAWARLEPKKLGSTQPQNIDYLKERKEDKHMQLMVSTFANLNFTLFLIFDLRNSRHKFYGLYFVVKCTIVLTVFLKTFLTRTYYVCSTYYSTKTELLLKIGILSYNFKECSK